MDKRTPRIPSWKSEIEELKKRDLYRKMPSVDGTPGRLIRVNNVDVLNFSSNNYLGLAAHPDVVAAAVDYTRRYGAGATASRLIAGNGEAHRELESFIAQWKRTEAALVFGSGYQANLGILSSLTTEADLILSDELNHASIIDACRLSKARVEVYPHVNLNWIEDLLRTKGFTRKLVVTESVFSMEGDRAPLKEIDTLCKRWGATLMVDEAHATGVLGPGGRGLAAENDICPDVQMGTLGKAVGSSGAYVAGSKALIELLVNKARSLVYTTAAPPGVMGAALASLRIIDSDQGNRLRTSLGSNTETFNGLLRSRFGLSSGPSHIVPFRTGESAWTMQVSERCLRGGIFAHGIRFPTVPEGAARLRFTLMSAHTQDDLQKAVSALETALSGEP